MRATIAAITFRWQRWRGQVLELLFPTRCVGCRRPGAAFCTDCRAQIELVNPPLCAVCGSPHSTPAARCGQCARHPLHLTQLRAAAFHQGLVRKAIHAFKYNRRTDLALPLADLLYQQLARQLLEIDLVAAVPLHPTRQRERGYNQAELLARAVAQRVGKPYADGLQRTRATQDQIGLNAAARHENMRKAFTAASNVFEGRCVLLIDDVCTTGATLDACAIALTAQGARAVYGLTVARPKFVEEAQDGVDYRGQESANLGRPGRVRPQKGQ